MRVNRSDRVDDKKVKNNHQSHAWSTSLEWNTSSIRQNVKIFNKYKIRQTRNYIEFLEKHPSWHHWGRSDRHNTQRFCLFVFFREHHRKSRPMPFIGAAPRLFLLLENIRWHWGVPPYQEETPFARRVLVIRVTTYRRQGEASRAWIKYYWSGFLSSRCPRCCSYLGWMVVYTVVPGTCMHNTRTYVQQQLRGSILWQQK